MTPPEIIPQARKMGEKGLWKVQRMILEQQKCLHFLVVHFQVFKLFDFKKNAQHLPDWC